MCSTSRCLVVLILNLYSLMLKWDDTPQAHKFRQRRTSYTRGAEVPTTADIKRRVLRLQRRDVCLDDSTPYTFTVELSFTPSYTFIRRRRTSFVPPHAGRTSSHFLYWFQSAAQRWQHENNILPLHLFLQINHPFLHHPFNFPEFWNIFTGITGKNGYIGYITWFEPSQPIV